MSLFRREVRQWVPEPIVPPFPGVDFGGSLSSPSSDASLQISAVWACVRLIAETVSMMPVAAFTYAADGSRVPRSLPSLIRQPTGDPFTSFGSFIYEVLVSLLLRGNAYALIASASGGFPTQLELLHPDKVTVEQDPNGGPITYRVGQKVYDASRIVHLKAFRFPGVVKGLSPIQYAATTIRTEAAVADFAYGFFRDGAHPSSLISFPAGTKITADEMAQAKKRFMASVVGREPLVLAGGSTFTPMQVSPEESQFLATQKYGVAEISRLFGVPPEMIASDVSNSMTYANVEQRSLDFLTYTVQPWITRIEDYFAMLLPAQQHIRLDTAVLTRTDFESKMKATAIGIASKQMTPDEARAMRDMPPLTAQQLDLLKLVPLDVGPTGAPKPIPAAAPEGTSDESNT